jgi:hypothetical protein
MQRAPSGFTRNSGDIDSSSSYGSMSAADIANDAGEEIMHGITRYSLTIVAYFCVVLLGAERAFGQMPKNEAAYGSPRLRISGGRTSAVLFRRFRLRPVRCAHVNRRDGAARLRRHDDPAGHW